MEPDPDRYFLRLAAAFVRGRYAMGPAFALQDSLRAKRLDDLSGQELARVFQCGLDAGLKLHKFKKTMGLERVRRVFGVLRSLAPETVLDVGTGRGVFVWPLLDEFPVLPVTAIDRDPERTRDLEAVRLGGIERLVAYEMDATDLKCAPDSFDVVTLLEVLEHVPKVDRAVAEVVRVARRFVVVSVPSKPDDNPHHLHLLDEKRLRELFSAAGVSRMKCDYVPGHIVAVANVQAEPC
ncbi:MAG: class I SAM-dependent methyltransferase [Planctomycetota bacterium]